MTSVKQFILLKSRNEMNLFDNRMMTSVRFFFFVLILVLYAKKNNQFFVMQQSNIDSFVNMKRHDESICVCMSYKMLLVAEQNLCWLKRIWCVSKFFSFFFFICGKRQEKRFISSWFMYFKSIYILTLIRFLLTKSFLFFSVFYKLFCARSKIIQIRDCGDDMNFYFSFCFFFADNTFSIINFYLFCVGFCFCFT